MTILVLHILLSILLIILKLSIWRLIYILFENMSYGGDIVVLHISGDSQIYDIFTKGLSSSHFKLLCSNLGVVSPYSDWGRG